MASKFVAQVICVSLAVLLGFVIVGVAGYEAECNNYSVLLVLLLEAGMALMIWLAYLLG